MSDMLTQIKDFAHHIVLSHLNEQKRKCPSDILPSVILSVTNFPIISCLLLLTKPLKEMVFRILLLLFTARETLSF